MWSFVGNKGNRQWVMIARDAASGLVIGMHVGCNDGRGIRAMLNKIDPLWLKKARFFTDNWKAYKSVLPDDKHEPGKGGLMNYAERFHLTVRQKVARMVRKTLSFSKVLKYHIAALIFFFNTYNLNLSLH